MKEKEKRTPLIQFRVGKEGLDLLIKEGIIDNEENWVAKEVNLEAKKAFIGFLESGKAHRIVDDTLDTIDLELKGLKTALTDLTEANGKLSQEVAELKKFIAEQFAQLNK